MSRACDADLRCAEEVRVALNERRAVERGVLDEHVRPLLLRELEALLPVLLLRVRLDALGDVAAVHELDRLGHALT